MYELDFDEPKTLKDYIDEHREMLEDMCIWEKLSADEQAEFDTCKTELRVDNKMRAYIRKYL